VQSAAPNKSLPPAWSHESVLSARPPSGAARTKISANAAEQHLAVLIALRQHVERCEPFHANRSGGASALGNHKLAPS
jgi:hypothetical protein